MKLFHGISIEQAEAGMAEHQVSRQDTVVGTFLQEAPLTMTEHPLVAVQSDWIIYLLLTMLAGLSLIVFALPEKLKGITFYTMVQNQGRTSERNIPASGMAIHLFLLINYLISTTLFIMLLLSYFEIDLDTGQGYWLMIGIIAGFVLAFYLYRIGLIRFLGIVFGTGEPAYRQQRLYSSTDFIIGTLMIPVLLLSVFIKNPTIIIAGIILIGIIHVFRWFQTFYLGNSISGVSAIHLIMYLCTLEIAPLLVVIKLMQTF